MTTFATSTTDRTDALNERSILRSLLERSGNGDRQAFAELYDLTSSRIFGTVLRILRDRGYTEECVQEVYLEVWQKAAGYTQCELSPMAWLVTMAHRRAVDRVRAEQSRSDRESRYGADVVKDDAAADLAINVIDGYFLDGAMEALTSRQRESIHLAYFEGLTHGEAAARLGVPISTLKSRIRGALTKLRVDNIGLCLAD